MLYLRDKYIIRKRVQRYYKNCIYTNFSTKKCNFQAKTTTLLKQTTIVTAIWLILRNNVVKLELDECQGYSVQPLSYLPYRDEELSHAAD